MIHTSELRKTFPSKHGPVEAVVGVDLAVEAGEIFGFLGPNGAGKTTTMRMLVTLLPPTSGAATVAGCDLMAAPGEVRRRIGYVAQQGGTDDIETARSELVLQARVFGSNRPDARARADELLQRFNLADCADRPT